jgi:hypothetical protein
MGILDQYEAADHAFRTSKVLTDSNEKLLEHLSGLSNQNNTNSGTQHRDIIRGITINHILLQRHIDDLNKQNEKTQKRVIALTIAALIAAAAQAITAILPYAGIVPTPPIAAAPQTPAPKSTDPIPVTHPSSGQPTKK